MEFLGKVTHLASEKGDEVVLVFNSKFAEYQKAGFFPVSSKKISKVDWLAEHYQKQGVDAQGISWREFFPSFERKVDLIPLDYQHSREIVNQLYQFFEFVFTTEKPDIVINEAPANIFNNLAYHFCQKYKVPYIGVIGSKFGGKIDIYDAPHTLSLYKKTFAELQKEGILPQELGFARQFIEDFTTHKKVPTYMEFQFEFSALQGPGRYLRRQVELAPTFWRYLAKRKHFKQFDYESESYVSYNFRRPFQSLLRELRAVYFKHAYKKGDLNEPFFLYPLHFHPEASTLVLATYFSDQLNTIKNIAFALPFPYKLYVKEHPIALGTRPGNFYQEIKKLPNVVLVDSAENNQSLIEASAGVITLTSTVGMEAALLGKPVYVLGDVFYEYHPACKKISNFDQLRQQLESDLHQSEFSKHTLHENVRFIISYYRHTIPGDVVSASKITDDNNYQDIYKSIKNIYLNIHGKN